MMAVWATRALAPIFLPKSSASSRYWCSNRSRLPTKNIIPTVIAVDKWPPPRSMTPWLFPSCDLRRACRPRRRDQAARVGSEAFSGRKKEPIASDAMSIESGTHGIQENVFLFTDLWQRNGPASLALPPGSKSPSDSAIFHGGLQIGGLWIRGGPRDAGPFPLPKVRDRKTFSFDTMRRFHACVRGDGFFYGRKKPRFPLDGLLWSSPPGRGQARAKVQRINRASYSGGEPFGRRHHVRGLCFVGVWDLYRAAIARRCNLTSEERSGQCSWLPDRRSCAGDAAAVEKSSSPRFCFSPDWPRPQPYRNRDR